MKNIDKSQLLTIIAKNNFLTSDSSEANRIAEDILKAVYGKDESDESIPVLVGTLKIKQGYGGYRPMEIGTPVYELDGRYFIEETSIANESIHRVFYRKESLSHVINFN